MQKDYYHILQLSPTATQDEIKRAFRRLALRYHPDKQPGNEWASRQFEDIYEAYSVLSDDKLRAHWESHSRSRNSAAFKAVPVTPAEVLDSVERLTQKILRSDPFRTDRDLLAIEIRFVFSEDNIRLLMDDAVASHRVIERVLSCLDRLPYHTVKEIEPLLERLAAGDPHYIKEIRRAVRAARQQYNWNRNKTLLALVIAAVVCVLIFLSGRK